jgi:hypothetical protein
MKKNMLSKTLVLGIVILFVGAVVVPSISSVSNQSQIKDTLSDRASFNPFLQGWKYRKMVPVNHEMVADHLTDFPVLVSYTDADLRDKAQIDGDDILFMDDKGEANQLNHEIEYFDDTTGEIVAWVNIPYLSPTDDTVFYLYYGNPNCASQQNPEMVWDDDYIAIYHMGGIDQTDIDDSTSNNLDVVGFLGNPIYQQTGKIGFCVDFDEDSLNVNDNDLLSFTGDSPMTVEAWVKCDIPQDGLHNPIVSKFGHGRSEWLFLSNGGTDRGQLYFIDESTGGTIWRFTESVLNVDNTGWNYIAGSYIGDETGFGISFVLDGVVEDGEAKVPGTYSGMENLGEPMRIGAYHNINEPKWYYWQGLIDEVRISKIARSSEWLITGYNNMNDPEGFSNFCTEVINNKVCINRPILQFLQNHPNMFPLLQKLIQNLGL